MELFREIFRRGVSMSSPRKVKMKVLITLLNNDVAPRMDLCTEVLIGVLDKDQRIVEQRHVILPRPSADELCQLILRDGIDVLVCGGIEEEYYQYLTWKKIQVLDSVIGSWQQALDSVQKGNLAPGMILPQFDHEVSNGGNS
jgi:predicted Fe-Mo cluster-binding NifX family protein